MNLFNRHNHRNLPRTRPHRQLTGLTGLAGLAGLTTVALLAALPGCGDDSGVASDTATGGESATTGETTDASASASATATDASATATTTAGSASESATQGSESATDPTTTEPTTTEPTTTEPTTTEPTTEPTTTDVTATESTEGETVSEGCGICDQPNQQCIDDICVTTCQGQDPDPCGPDQVCDVISGECTDPEAACILSGAAELCDGKLCGPGSVCDGLGQCVAIAPCAGVLCTDEGGCWGTLCSCTRQVECEEPSAADLNGPFSTDIGGLDFADDCNAWMVTLRSGPDYLRRLTPDGEVTTWTGTANLNMGEVRILKRLTVPQSFTDIDQLAGQTPPPPQDMEGLGEVAITYTCCPTCGCQADPPQGVARLDEGNQQNPLPIIIVATATQGSGPFGSAGADAGPQGLTWGEDRVLYVGNSTNNGDLNTADLDQQTQELLFTFDSRVTAAAPVSPAHILIGLIGGEVYRYNTKTQELELVIDLMADITSLSHDSFSGLVYAGLSTLEVVELHPFTGEVATFAEMPGKGRVAVSPSGKLWYTPIKYLANLPLSSWPLPDSF